MFRVLKLFAIFIIISVLAQGMIFSDRKPANAESYAAPCSRDAELSAHNCRVEAENITPCAICKPSKIRRPFVTKSPEVLRDFYRQNSNIYALDGKEYTKDQLVKSFIDSAYQKYAWQGDTYLVNGYFTNIPLPILDYSKMFGPTHGGRAGQWYAEYIERKRGMPKFDTVYRWKAKNRLRVTLCFLPGHCGPEDDQMVNLLKKQIAATSAFTQEITGIELSYVSPGLDDPANPAEIRILLSRAELFFPDNMFKTTRITNVARHPLSLHFLSDAGYFEAYALGGVRFTPYARAQVEGYIIPDHENNINYAVCHIWPQHQKEVIASLFNECLLRALGLPEVITDHEAGGLLRPWNNTYDPVSMRSVLDGPQVNEGLYRYLLSNKDDTLIQYIGEYIPDDKYVARLVRAIKTAEWKDLFSEYPAIVEQVANEYDLAILSMLYCKDILPGMNRYDVIEAFYRSNSCFEFDKIKYKEHK